MQRALAPAPPAASSLRRAAPRALRCAAAAAAQPGAPLSVTLRRPLGIVFEERVRGAAEGVFVGELVPGGNAAKAGVAVGDVLLRVSATVLKDGSKAGEFEKEGYGQRPYTNWERIMIETSKVDFDTVLGAIASNNERWGIMDVVLELQRPGASSGAAVAPSAAATAPAAPAPPPPAPAPPAAANTLVEVEMLAPSGASTTAVVSGEPDGTLRDLLRAADVAVYDAWGTVWNCGGGGQCGLCAAAVLEGGSLLTERTGAEEKHLVRKGKPDTWRLTCQACVQEGARGTLRVQAQPQAVKK